MPKGVVIKQHKKSISALPVLPKAAILEKKEPPGCPLKGIEFVKIKEFTQIEEKEPTKMSDCFDQSAKKNMGKSKEERLKLLNGNNRRPAYDAS